MSSIVSSVAAQQAPSVFDRFVHAFRMLMVQDAGQVEDRRNARRLADAMVVPGA